MRRTLPKSGGDLGAQVSDKSGWGPVVANILLGCSIFYFLVQGYHHSNGYRIEDTSGYSPIELVGLAISDRAIPALLEGELATNRAYVFDNSKYMARHPLGSGLGLANLQFQTDVSAKTPVSFLSLYRFFFASTGPVGLALLILALIWPVAAIRSWAWVRGNSWLLALYLTSCIMFYGVMEELTFSFAVVVGLLAHSQMRPAPELERGTSPNPQVMN